MNKRNKEMEQLIIEHKALCKELHGEILRYKELNRELTKMIAECKGHIKEAIELTK